MPLCETEDTAAHYWTTVCPGSHGGIRSYSLNPCLRETVKDDNAVKSHIHSPNKLKHRIHPIKLNKTIQIL